MSNSFDWDKYQQTIDELSQKNELYKIELQVFDCLASTNKKLWQLIDDGAKIPLAILALQQTAGQGQWGKTWQSSSGGLYLSVALKCDLALENSFHLVMATATGIANFLRSYQLPVTIKWSNDLILNNHKLGGIKIETRSRSLRGTSRSQNKIIKYAVVGVGINWHNTVPEIGINLKSYYQNQQAFGETNQVYSPAINSLEQLTAITIAGIINGYQNYLQLGAKHTLAQYQQLLNSINQQITINHYSGTITGVTPQGQLKVRLQSPGAATEIYLSPGEISLGYEINSVNKL